MKDNMNQKVLKWLHIAYATIYAGLLYLPVYFIFKPLEYYATNSYAREDNLGHIFSLETGVMVICFILLIVSLVQNSKLIRRPFTPSHQAFLVFTGVGIILPILQLLFGYIIPEGESWGQEIFVGLVLLPAVSLCWVFSIVLGFLTLKRTRSVSL